MFIAPEFIYCAAMPRAAARRAYVRRASAIRRCHAAPPIFVAALLITQLPYIDTFHEYTPPPSLFYAVLSFAFFAPRQR